MSEINPPIAERIPYSTTVHGQHRKDDYHWLRERENSEVIAYLEEENSYTKKTMQGTEKLQKNLYDEMIGRVQQTDLNVPVRWGEYWYYSRTEEGKQYPIYCRKMGSMEEKEEVLLDLNAEAQQLESDYLNLGVYRVSPNHTLLAYSFDTDGSEEYQLQIRDLQSGKDLPDTISGTNYSMEWAADNSTLFYAVHDDTRRPHKILCHKLGEEVSQDRQVYHEEDEQFSVGLSKTGDEEYIVLSAGSKETSEEYLLRSDNPEGEFTLVAQRKSKVEYSVDHRKGILYILTNEEASNFRLMQTPITQLDREAWQEMVPSEEHIMLRYMEMFADYLVLNKRMGGLTGIACYHFDSEEWKEIEFDEEVYTVSTKDNREFNSHVVRFSYTSLTTPESIYDYDMGSGERTLLKQKVVLGGYDPSLYHAERILARADDGERVPISLVYRKDTFKGDGSNPCLLYGYGSYGFSLDPWFDSNRLSLLDRGLVFAIGHIRGGQEMGRRWYDEGKFLKKKNTFTDFIACGETLIEAGYTSKERLAIEGGSAGGMLIGAVINMRPDLAHVAIASVPFVDVINTMLDETLPLTIGEYEEWGNPNEKEFFDYMLSYSPYDNVEAKEYPHLLILAGLNDPRVQYWEPAKWTAKLRATKTDQNRLLLKTNMGAGHGGASGRYDYLKEKAFEYAFLIDMLSIESGGE